MYRHPEKAKARENTILGKEVIGITKSGKISTLAKSVGTGWTLMDSHWSLHREKNSNGDGHLFVLHGEKMVCIHALVTSHVSELHHNYRYFSSPLHTYMQTASSTRK